MITFGVDAHKQVHMVVAVNELGVLQLSRVDFSCYRHFRMVATLMAQHHPHNAGCFDQVCAALPHIWRVSC